MKIRTITTGITLDKSLNLKEIEKAAHFNIQAMQRFEDSGYAVQSTRVSTNPCYEYLNSLSNNEIMSKLREVDRLASSEGIGFFCIGYVDDKRLIELIPEINAETSLSCSVNIADMEKGINRKNIALTARVFKDNSRNEEGGTGNFRFCAISNCPPHIPYFPSSYHKGDICFSIGMENSSLLHKAFKNGMGLDDTRASLKPVLEEETSRIEGIATEIAASMGIGFSGIDASITPSLSREESIAFAFERLGLGKFGQSGTLSIAGMVTSVLKGLSIKTCGYTGLMLPLCEDYGLAKRADEGCFGINDLLLFSSVCGCGLDTIPIAGDVENDRIEALLLDVASLSLKLNKPLSARLLPIPNKGVGEYTCFNSPYMVDCRVMDI